MPKLAHPRPHVHSSTVLGGTIRQIRGKLSQFDFAQIIGAQQNKVSRMERGLAEPSPAELVAIAHHAGRSIDELLTVPINAQPDRVPVIGTIEMGVWRSRDTTQRESARTVLFNHHSSYADYPKYGVEIKGDAAAPAYPSGSVAVIVYFSDLDCGPKSHDNVVCIRHGLDGKREYTIRRYTEEGATGKIWLTRPGGMEDPFVVGATNIGVERDVEIVSLVIGGYHLNYPKT